MEEEKKFYVRRVSFYKNPQTNKIRKHIVLPAEISDNLGRLCKMLYNEETNTLIIKFAKAPPAKAL